MISHKDVISIMGPGFTAIDFALRKVLKFKECSGPVVVFDYQGRATALLGKDNLQSLRRRPVDWYDLADRSRPMSFFEPTQSPHFQRVFHRVLLAMRRLTQANVSVGTLRWATDMALRLSNDGKVGLVALLKTLHMTATRRWFLDTQPDPTDYERLIEMVRWTLRFSAVLALTNGNNRHYLSTSLSRPMTTWIEAKAEHFETVEHQLAVSLVEAALEDSIRSLDFDEQAKNGDSRITVLHILPTVLENESVPEWIFDTAGRVRHIAVHALFPRRNLSPCALSWARTSSQLWVMRGKNPPDGVVHGKWLTLEDVEHIEKLEYNQVLVKVKGHEKSLIARVRLATKDVMEAHRWRFLSGRRRNKTAVKQLTSTISDVLEVSRENVDLYRQLCTVEALHSGWVKVRRAKKTSRGVDNVTIDDFRSNMETQLEILADELASRTYQCRPLKRVYIPKPSGGKRGLGIACVRDRVVQSACLELLEPLFEMSFSRFSFAFRPRKNAHQALAVAQSYIKAGAQWAVIADIKKCFDNIDHDVLMGMLAQKIGDQAILDLIQHWLTVDVLDFIDIIPTDVGVPQGESISPLLANIYLDPLDKHFEKLGLRFVRYADDIVIFSTSEDEAKKSLQHLGDFLNNPLHLELKPAKTSYVPVESGFDFLGFALFKGRASIQKEKIKKIIEVARSDVKLLGSQGTNLNDRANALFRMNAVIRGFRNYFRLANEKKIFEQLLYLDGRMEQLGHYYLSEQVRDDPAWICRERFAFKRHDEIVEIEKEGDVVLRKSLGDYLHRSKRESAQGWMIKGEDFRDHDNTKRKTTIQFNDSEESGEESEEDRTPDSVVAYSDRLFVLTHGSYLTCEADDLVVRKKQKEIYRKPLASIGLLFLQGIAMNISVALQVKFAEADVPVVFAPPVGEPMAILNSLRSSKSHLRGMQVLRRNDPDIIQTGLAMLGAKTGNQAAVLKYFAKYRKKVDADLAEKMIEASNEIRRFSEMLRELDSGSASIRSMAMGYEGHAASIYWGQLTKLAPQRTLFEGRVTRHAKDVVNQCLNYVYGILYGEVWRAVAKAGLDPYFGFVHGSKRNQGSLVFDIIEEFRAPFADRVVFGLFGRGFQPDQNGEGLLRTKTRKTLAKRFSKGWTKNIAWRSKTTSPARILEQQAGSIAKLVAGEGTYHPYRMRW